MMDATALGVALVSLNAAAIAPWLAYRTAKRRFAGTVATTDATALWKESQALREAYLHDMVALRAGLDAANAERLRERGEMIAEIQGLRAELRTKDARIAQLEESRGALNLRVAELESELRRLESTAVATMAHLGGTT